MKATNLNYIYLRQPMILTVGTFILEVFLAKSAKTLWYFFKKSFRYGI